MSRDVHHITALDAKTYASQRLVAAWVTFGDVIESNHGVDYIVKNLHRHSEVMFRRRIQFLFPRPLRERVKWSSLKQVGVARRQVTLLLLVQKKVTKLNDTPCHGLRLPCTTRQIRRLRNSLRSDSPRRKLLTCLRCSAWQQGIENQASNHFYFDRTDD